MEVPYANVYHKLKLMATFYGDNCKDLASIFISGLPEPESGRFAIDVNDFRCPHCQDTYSKEAINAEYNQCPICSLEVKVE